MSADGQRWRWLLGDIAQSMRGKTRVSRIMSEETEKKTYLSPSNPTFTPSKGACAAAQRLVR
jgi:hypothetical protein